MTQQHADYPYKGEHGTTALATIHLNEAIEVIENWVKFVARNYK